jgi:hypothetical protein
VLTPVYTVKYPIGSTRRSSLFTLSLDYVYHRCEGLANQLRILLMKVVGSGYPEVLLHLLTLE